MCEEKVELVEAKEWDGGGVCRREWMEVRKENVFTLAHQRIKVRQVVESRGRGTFINFTNSLTHSSPFLPYRPLLDLRGYTQPHK